MPTPIYNPRDNLSHDIAVGQVYGAARTKVEQNNGTVTYDEHLCVVYEDDERVLCRSNLKLKQGNDYHYLLETRDTFESAAAEGFYKLLEDVENPPPVATDGRVAVLKIAKQHRDRYQHAVDVGGGRKQQHKLEALQELVEEMESINPTEIDWATVDGIGAKTADNLREAGIETDTDVLAVSDEDLLAIEGVGNGNLENLKTRAASD